jgi:hypothetical protein
MELQRCNKLMVFFTKDCLEDDARDRTTLALVMEAACERALNKAYRRAC